MNLPKLQLDPVTLKHHTDIARYGYKGIVSETIKTEAGVITHDIGPEGRRYVERAYSGAETPADWVWTEEAKQDAWLIRRKLGL